MVVEAGHSKHRQTRSCRSPVTTTTIAARQRQPQCQRFVGLRLCGPTTTANRGSGTKSRMIGTVTSVCNTWWARPQMKAHISPRLMSLVINPCRPNGT